jgi:hypothetical protein
VPTAYVAQLAFRGTAVTGLDAAVDLVTRKVIQVLLPPGDGTVISSRWIGKAPPEPPGD